MLLSDFFFHDIWRASSIKVKTNIFANMQTIESQSHRQICLDYIIIIKIISNLLFLDSFEGLHPFRSSLFANMQNIERQTDLFRLFAKEKIIPVNFCSIN